MTDYVHKLHWSMVLRLTVDSFISAYMKV